MTTSENIPYLSQESLEGLQVTTQRVAILESVAEQPHCTAESVESDVCTRIGSISRQAVYDGLGTLVEHGLLRRIQPSRSPARFETRHRCRDGSVLQIEVSANRRHKDMAGVTFIRLPDLNHCVHEVWIACDVQDSG